MTWPTLILLSFASFASYSGEQAYILAAPCSLSYDDGAAVQAARSAITQRMQPVLAARRQGATQATFSHPLVFSDQGARVNVVNRAFSALVGLYLPTSSSEK
jgi:hypothetical protein